MLIVLVLPGVLLFGPHPEPDQSANDCLAEWKFLLSGIRESREKWQSGAGVFEGERIVRSDDDPENNLSANLKGQFAFDIRENLYRFDQYIPYRTQFKNSTFADAELTNEVKISTEASITTQIHRFTFIRNDDLLATYESAGESDTDLDLYVPDTEIPLGQKRLYHVADLRSVGLFDFWQFTGQEALYGSRPPDESTGLMCRFEEILDELSQRTPLSITRDGDVATIAFAFYTLELDTKNYCPLKYWNHFGETKLKSEVEWESIEGVFVPARFLTLEDSLLDGTFVSVEYKLKWNSVNSSVPSELLDYEALELPDGVQAVDQRGSVVRKLGVWEDGKFNATLIEANTASVRPSRLWPILVTLGVCVLLVWALAMRRPTRV